MNWNWETFLSAVVPSLLVCVPLIVASIKQAGKYGERLESIEDDLKDIAGQFADLGRRVAKNDSRIAVAEERSSTSQKQVDRIESKLDRLVEMMAEMKK